MKTKLLLLLFLFAFKMTTFAQNKVVKYCVVTASPSSFVLESIRPTLSIGKVDSLFSLKDSSIKIQLLKVNSFKTMPDVLNYMTSIGWTFITSPPNYFIFKREFDPSELTTTTNH